MYIRWIYLCKHNSTVKACTWFFSAAKKDTNWTNASASKQTTSAIRFISLSYMVWISFLISTYIENVCNVCTHICIAANFFLAHSIIAWLRSLRLWLKKDKKQFHIWFALANSFKTKIHLVWLGLGLGLVSCFIAAFAHIYLTLHTLLFYYFCCFFSSSCRSRFRLFLVTITYSCIFLCIMLLRIEKKMRSSWNASSSILTALHWSFKLENVNKFSSYIHICVCGYFFFHCSLHITRHFAKHCLHYICF